ncbi:hypothetical protein [Nocardioides aquiterrae]|uniref:Uncharacterized protein n=1 Tax=Nocardioides aquiterrae TaxID=203799 RepID=A0ABP4F1B3_9ACTN
MRRLLPALVALLLVALAAPASATPPTERTISDPAEAGKAYDIVSVTMKAAPAAGRKAQVTVVHSRRVDVGDGIDVWVDTDDDRVPDLFITGLSFSEYGVYKARDWDRHHQDITDRGCASVKMTGARSVIRFDPSCLGASERFAVSVRSHGQDRPARTDDYVPRPERWTKKVLSYAS